jgi:hypothetical protein
MKKILAIAALAGLSACTVYPDGTTVVHSPPAATYVAPAPVYVAPAPVYRPYYQPYYAPRPYYYNRYYR